MTDHDPLCKQRFDPYQPPCPECEILATGRADERAKVEREEVMIYARAWDEVTNEVMAKVEAWERLPAKAGKLPRRYRKEHGKWLITVDVADLASLWSSDD